MSRPLSRWQALLLGLVVLVGLGMGGMGIFAVGSRQWLWADTFHVRAGFPQVRGVEVGTRVRVQGVDAGEVVEVRPPLTPGGQVEIRLRIDGKLRHLIRSDASAQIIGEGMVGGRVVEILPGTAAADPVRDEAVLASKPSAELADVLSQVDQVLQGIRDGKGSLGKLVKDDRAYEEILALARQGQGTLASIKQPADAFKDLPILRNYVKDANKLLVRPDCERNRKVFHSDELFAANEATLTGPGRDQLDRLGPWIEGLKHKNSEVVIAAYADPALNSEVALNLTQKQSEAVSEYLKTHHAADKLNWWSRRAVTPLGLGLNPPPLPEKDKLPTPRVEVVVFVPRG